ncbi:hypothetical protein K438DRAFT_382410 [Mycena galopus ATCC 62051]|nr:hypothetical protein K438DRAFT_382410 [Mycena galopus ATCC 62051]
MRRVRGGPILQPFVDDRPPADSALTGNVFATGSFATASSVTAAAATRTGASGPSAGAGADGTLGPSLNASAGAFEARLGTGAGAGAGAATTGALGRYPSEKTPDYTNLHSQPEVSGQPSQSTQSAISRTNTLMSPLEKHREMEQETALSPSTVRALSTVFSQAPSTVLSPSDAETSARERYLEQRLATLEAHVASYLPPPYEQPESEP